jgi:hypothetical protein
VKRPEDSHDRTDDGEVIAWPDYELTVVGIRRLQNDRRATVL